MSLAVGVVADVEEVVEAGWLALVELGGDEEGGDRIAEYVNRQSIYVPFDKAWLADETDVNRYLVAYRKAMMEEIEQGKRIQI